MKTVPSSQNSKHRYTFAELVQQCDSNAQHSADLALWDALRPIGNEVLDDTLIVLTGTPILTSEKQKI